MSTQISSLVSSINRSKFTPEQRAKALAILDELQRRGMDVPPEIASLATIQKMRDYVLAPNGYWPKLDGSLFHPEEFHSNFIHSNALFVGFYGSRGSGKSISGSQKACFKIRDGEPGMVINPDFENFKISTWPEFREWLPWDMVVPKHQYMKAPDWQPTKPFKITFIHPVKGSVNVWCKGIKDPDSARGPNINWLWYDEAQRDETGVAFKIAIACVRIGNNPQSWCTYTPKGYDHWTYKTFELKELPEDARNVFEEFAQTSNRPLIECFTGTLEQNRKNLAPEFVAAMFSMYAPGYLRDRELLGMYADEGGNLGDSSWFDNHFLDDLPETITIKKTIRYWDLAASEKKISKGDKKADPDETVGTRLSWDGGQDFYVENQVCGYWKWEGILDAITQTAEKDGPQIRIYVEQEGAAGGKNQVEAIKLHIRDKLGSAWHVEEHRPAGDKVMRANPWFAEASQGHFWMIRGNWNKITLNQIASFPNAKHDDRVDSISGARFKIAPYKLWKHTQFLHL